MDEATANAETAVTARCARPTGHDHDATAPAMMAAIDLRVSHGRTDIRDAADAIERGCRRGATGRAMAGVPETVVMWPTPIAIWPR